MYRNLARDISRTEAKIRKFLFRYPLVYGLLAGISFVFFWKGVDDIATAYDHVLTGPILLFISIPVLVILGVFLPFFINDRSLLSRLTKEEEEVEKETEKVEKEEVRE